MQNFLKDEAGAVTIDWVALAAGLLILGVGLVAVLTTEVQSVVDAISSELESATDQDTIS